MNGIAPAEDAAPRRWRQTHRLRAAIRPEGDRWFPYLAVAPVIVIIGALLLAPVAYAFYLSFHETDGRAHEFVGLDNYSALLQSADFWRVLLNNGIFLLAVPIVVTASLIAAVLIYERVWGWRFFRIAFFFPSVVSSIVIGALFRSFFSTRGPVNTVLGAAGAGPIDWFGSEIGAIVVVFAALVWASFGYGAVILLAGLSSIDPELFQAARLDGASWAQRLRYVTLPLISRSIRFVAVINVIYTFTALFGFIYVLTRGGPGYATTTLDYFIYLKGFAHFDLGEASALAFMLVVILVVLTVIQFRMFRSGDT